jgi:hypothetical protein
MVVRMSEKSCSQCGGKMDNGYVAGHGRDEIIYTTLNPAGRHDGAPMNAYACLDCGHVALSVDVARLRQGMGK